MPGPAATQPLGIAILGCGRISAHHARAIGRLPQHGRVVVVADQDAARAAALAAAHGVAATARDLDEVLARRAVDAVLVCTPNALHADQSIRILESGRDVLVEKPFAENAADAERMAECTARTGRVQSAAKASSNSGNPPRRPASRPGTNLECVSRGAARRCSPAITYEGSSLWNAGISCRSAAPRR